MVPSQAPDSPAPLTRRQLRARKAASSPALDEADTDESSATDELFGADEPSGAPTAASAGSPTGSDRPRALSWLDESTVAADGGLRGGAFPGVAFEVVSAPLVERWPRRSLWRPGVLVPPAIVAAVIGVYVAAMLFWPLHAVAPRVSEISVEAGGAATPALPWPAEGSAAIEVEGVGNGLASAYEQVPMASIAKVVAVLVALEGRPLNPGEQGPEYAFGFADRTTYWNYLAADESALDVPVGGVLTEYQLLQGILLGSAGNYLDRLVSDLYPTDAVYAAAANEWLRARGITGITITDPTGIDPGTVATPDALLTLGQRALANPVVAEIVATPSVELPGAGLVENTNGLIGDPGVVGIKTGSLFGAFNLLSAKDVTIGETTVRMFAVVLGQPDDEARLALSRTLFDQVESELAPTVAVEAGARVGTVTTLWGTEVDIVTTEPASVVLWNDASASADATLALDDAREARDPVGTLTVTGPVDQTTVTAALANDIEGPSPWWRITHPLDLLGLNR